ncbi:kinase-like protein [Rhizophagus irregularis]|uniref:Kinase-like protein n=1 Tax=Rhizophagus irregularis TaxID=588596 RepID=A0A2N1MWY1_9GLOM|nr:kinase-like protein [Rhizophagus irregularis]
MNEGKETIEPEFNINGLLNIKEGWTSGNDDIDKFIKNTIYDVRNSVSVNYKLIEWVQFDRFEDIKQIGEGGFTKMEKKDPKPIKVALKKLNNSQNMTTEYLNELKTHWKFSKSYMISLQLYGMTKDLKTQEFMMIVQFADQGNLRNILSNNFNNILWKDKITYLFELTMDLRNLHGLGYLHKDLHSGNILQISDNSKINNCYISDFGLSRPSNEQISDNKICGVLPYIAPEVLNGEPYTSSSDIYSVGVIMAELSSGKLPFYKGKHNAELALKICNGLRPEFGKGTPEIYKNLAYKCMNVNPNQRQTANELFEIFKFWCNCNVYQEKDNFDYKGKEIKAIFEKADKEISNISTSYKKDPDAIYTSRVFYITKPL